MEETNGKSLLPERAADFNRLDAHHLHPSRILNLYPPELQNAGAVVFEALVVLGCVANHIRNVQ